MKYVAPIRKKIGSRTIFNLLGPLSSPANVKRQVVGVFAKKWLLPFAHALKNLQSEHAWIVHSEDGMDEISPFTITNVIELKNGEINEIKIDPKKIGVKFSNPDNLKGKDPDYNASKIIDIFSTPRFVDFVNGLLFTMYWWMYLLIRSVQILSNFFSQNL